MANATLLSLFQTTLQSMGVVTYGLPSTVISNTNQDVVQTLALVHGAGDEILREYPWQASLKQHIFQTVFYEYTGDTITGSTSVTNMSSVSGLTTTPTYFQVEGNGIPQDCFLSAATGTTVTLAQEAEASGTTVSLTFNQVLYSPPSDFDAQLDKTHWDKTKHWEMLGPSTPQQREWLRSGFISTGPRIRYSYIGGFFMIWPQLGAEDSLAYEYRSKNWILATGGTAPTKQLFTADTDTTIYPDPLMRALIKLKYLEAKGMDTTAAKRYYDDQIGLAKAHDSGSLTLSMAPRLSSVLLTQDNIPDSGYGS